MNKENYIFHVVLVITLLLTLCAGGYESYMERYDPDYSVLHLMHRYGYLKEYPVIYEPGKGIWHPLGWIGSGMMMVMMLYSVRKRMAWLASFGSLRHWLTAHMFLGILGPLFVTLHTTFKFGGIIATSFWSMIITMIFGILGRYIYVQIPRSLAGTELEVQDIECTIETIDAELSKYSGGIKISDFSKVINAADIDPENIGLLKTLLVTLQSDVTISYRIFQLNRILKTNYHIPRKIRKEIDFLLKKKAALIRKRNYLSTSHRLLHYWHIVHIPLAIVMFLIMMLHVVIYYLFRPTHAV